MSFHSVEGIRYWLKLSQKKQQSLSNFDRLRKRFSYQPVKPVVKNNLPKNKLQGVFKRKLKDNTQEKSGEDFLYKKEDVSFRDKVAIYLINHPVEMKLFIERCSLSEKDHTIVDQCCLPMNEFIDFLEEINYPEDQDHRLYDMVAEEINRMSIYSKNRNRTHMFKK